MNPAAGGESRAIADIGSHCFDLAQYVLGKDITAVYAKRIRVYPFRKKPTGGTQTFEKAAGGVYETVPVENEDAAYIMAEFDGGIQGLFYVSQVCAGAKNGLKICVSGKEKSLTWEQERPDHLRIGNRDGGNEDCYAGAGYLTDYAKAFAQLPDGRPHKRNQRFLRKNQESRPSGSIRRLFNRHPHHEYYRSMPPKRSRTKMG